MASVVLLLKNGQIADGSGGPLRVADVLIQDGYIRDIGEVSTPADGQVIDCSGCVVSPGFIDAHSHSDLQVLGNRPEKLLQGVTAEVVGNCGFSPYPNGRPAELREFGNGILFGGDEWGWASAADYLLEVHARAGLASVCSLVGHGSLRIAHAGNKQGPVEEETLAAMEHTLDDALSQGATGFSTGLMYAPGSSAPPDELLRLCQVVAKRDKIYCSHIRDYSTHLLAAIDEQIELAKATGCRLQISHLQAVGRANWKLNQLALEQIEKARHEGVDVMFDCYPYVAGSTVLTQLLPQWALDGGIGALLERLKDDAARLRIEKETLDKMVHDWSDIFISGESLDELSKQRSESPMDCVFNLLVENQGAVNMLTFNQSEENLRANLTHPLSIVISDGFYVKGKPHPRLHGTFPELLGNICRDKQWLSLPEAIHKVTGAPAKRFSIAKRGLLQPGFIADITIFNAAAMRSHSTYKQPEAAPEGVVAVLREGRILLNQTEKAPNHGIA